MSSHNILLVDDEPNVLSSLQRLFRKKSEYSIFIANSGKEGLSLLEKHNFSLVISDERMPQMNGAEFLSNVKALWPDTIRIILTGYADIKAAMEAINSGEIYRFITKPWDDLELQLTVSQALQHHELLEHNKRLNELTNKQNEELKGLNQNLEEKVKKRTLIISEKKDELDKLYQELEVNFFDSIRVFVDILDLYNPLFGNHCRRTALISRLMAAHMGLPEKEIEAIEIAAMLHDVGMIGIPKEMSNTRQDLLSSNNRKIYEQHPAIGQMTIQHVKKLDSVGVIIKAHHERFDGKGFPDKMSGEDIPLNARIITAPDFYDYAHTVGLPGKDTPNIHDIRGYMEDSSGKMFDPDILQIFFTVLDSLKEKSSDKKERHIDDLKEGMVVAKDVFTDSGSFLIAKGTILNNVYINKIKSYRNVGITEDTIFVYK